MSTNNYVENNYAGIVGGTNNKVNNIFYVGETIIGHPEKADTKLSAGISRIAFMELINLHLDKICADLDKSMSSKRHPLKIEITNLVRDCSRLVYFNNGNNTDVEQLVNDLFSIAFNPYMEIYSGYEAKLVRVASEYFFELHPQK